MFMGFLKEVLTKILKKSNTIDREEMKAIYRVLLEIRRELVDAFYIIAERKLRELYDGFSMTMLKLDKTIQVLRRALGEPVNTTYTRLKKAELEEELKKLSPELSQALRTLIYSTELLKEFAQSMPYYYLRAVVKSIDDNVDRAVKALGEVT
jgi:hypothetical protein